MLEDCGILNQHVLPGKPQLFEVNFEMKSTFQIETGKFSERESVSFKLGLSEVEGVKSIQDFRHSVMFDDGTKNPSLPFLKKNAGDKWVLKQTKVHNPYMHLTYEIDEKGSLAKETRQKIIFPNTLYSAFSGSKRRFWMEKLLMPIERRIELPENALYSFFYSGLA